MRLVVIKICDWNDTFSYSMVLGSTGQFQETSILRDVFLLNPSLSLTMQPCSTFLIWSHGTRNHSNNNTAQFQHFDHGSRDSERLLIESSYFAAGIELSEPTLGLFATHDPLCYNASDAGHGAVW